MYSGVPATKPVRVSFTSSATRARPKSVSLTRSLRRFEQDVARLDVAVDQPLGVGGRQTLRRLHADADDLVSGSRFSRSQPLFQRFAGDELHHQVGQALASAACST